MKKRFLAIILAAIMILCLVPSVALAAEESGIQLGAGGLGTDDTVLNIRCYRYNPRAVERQTGRRDDGESRAIYVTC